MSRRALARILWLAFLVTVPVPFFLVEVGLEPVAAILLKLAFTVVIIAVESSAGAIRIAAWLLGAQALVAAALLWVAARLVARAVDHAAGRRAPGVVAAIVAMLLLVACIAPIYRSPFRSTGLQSTLLEVFE